MISLNHINLESAFCQDFQLLPGFPLILDSISGEGFAPIIADFDNDKINEILICYNGLQGKSKIFLIGHDGNIMNNWPKIVYDVDAMSAAGDINTDGYIDIVIRTKDSIFVFDRFGNHLPGFPVFFPSGALKSIALYDLDKDGFTEIITTGFNKAVVYNSNGLIRNGWPVILPGADFNRVFPSPVSIADIDDDNFSEIFIPSSYCETVTCDSSFINIFKHDGSPHKISPIKTDSGYFFRFAPLCIGRKDSSLIFYINSTIEHNDIVKTRTSEYDQNGILKRVLHTNNFINSTGPVSYAYMPEHFNNQIISFGYQGGPSFLLKNNFSVSPGWPISTNSFSIKSLNIIEINREICIISNENYADTSGGYIENYGYIKAFNESGLQYRWSPIRSRGIPVSAPVICDLNSDGKTDIVTLNEFFNGSQSGKIIYAWTNKFLNFKYTELHWPMYAHDRYRTNQYGFVPPDEPVGIQPYSSAVPESFSLFQNYPNPFNPATTIKFDIINSGVVTLTIFDALGRQIETLVNERLRAGTYSLTFDGSKYNSGVYFYRLATESYSESKKMLMVK